MDCVERLKEGVEEILSGAGTLETLSRMQERVCQIAAGSVPWHLSEKQLNAELFDVLRRVWNFSLGLENTTKKSERGEYFGMLRYFCVGVVLYLVVERGINDDPDSDSANEYGVGYEDDGIVAKMKALSVFQMLRMTLHTGRVCMEYVPDTEKAQFCYKIVIQQYIKIRDGGSSEEIQIILREIIRILYCNGKIFQSEDDDQEDLKGLLLAASVLSKDCPDEGSCFAVLCLRNGSRLAGMSRYRKAAVWLTAATRNAHFLETDKQAMAFRRLAQVYFEWGAIDDFPDAIAGLDKANSLVYHPTGALLKLKIVLASKQSKDPLDEEIEELVVELLNHVDIASLELIVSELKSFGFHSAASFALDRVLAKSTHGQETQQMLHLHLLRVNINLTNEGQNKPELPHQQQQQLQHYNQQNRRSFYRFLTDKTNRPFLDDLRHVKGRKLSSKLHSTIWNLAKNCLSRGDFQESIEWYRASLTFLEPLSSSTSASTACRSQPRVEAKLRRNLAKCFVELEDYAAAEEQVEASLTLDPNCLLSLYRSFTVRLHSGRGLEETMKAFELLFVSGDGVERVEGGKGDKGKTSVTEDSEDSVNVESVVSLAMDETFKSSRVDVIEAVIETSLGESARRRLSNQTILIVLRRALLLVFEKEDEKAVVKRIEYLKMAFDILKGDIQNRGDTDAGLRQTMLSEVDWFTPMAWNTIGSSDSVASLDNFLLTFKFLALKEVRIRESLDFEEKGGGEGGGGDKLDEEEERLKRESMTSLLQVNLDMQNQMLGSAVDAGLQKIRIIKTGGDAGGVASTISPKEETIGVLEVLFKVCEKRRRVLTELESFAGSSESLLNCKLMAAIYHFEVCAKSHRHSHMSTLLGEIASLASLTEDSIPSFTIFESLVDFCADSPADPHLNYLVVCDCFVLAMKARAASLTTQPSTRPASTTPLVHTMPKVFEDALDFVTAIGAFNKGDMTVIADRFSTCFGQFLSSPSSSSSSAHQAASDLANDARSPLATLATKSLDLGLICRKEGEDDAASKWSRLALNLAHKGGTKELQKKIVAQVENIIGQKP